MSNVFEEAKNALEQFMGGPVLTQAKAVISEIEDKLSGGAKTAQADAEKALADLKAEFDKLSKQVEDRAAVVEARFKKVETAVQAAVKAELAKAKSEEPAVKAAVEAALKVVLDAFKASMASKL